MTLQQLKYAVTIAESKSMNKAAKELFVSQPSLSSTIQDLEKEIGIVLFSRSNRGISITPEGEGFLGYARQMIEQYRLIEDRYIENKNIKKRFSVSMQHYTFAVQAFIEMTKEFGMDEYEFAIHETQTFKVIENVSQQKSEIGILYINDFNQKAMYKIFHQKQLEFVPLFPCNIYVYLWKNNPLAHKKEITFQELEDYPCLSFEQGDNNSFYFAEEVFSTREYTRIIKANDRATFLNLMVGLQAYTLCSGIICEDLNGGEYKAVPLVTKEQMMIGYIKKKRMPLSQLGVKYIDELSKFKKMVL